MIQFAKEQSIPLGEVKPTKILLGRDTRPSGQALLEAAKQVCSFLQICCQLVISHVIYSDLYTLLTGNFYRELVL